MQKFLILLLSLALGIVVFGSYQLLYGIDNQFQIWGLKIELTSIQINWLPVSITLLSLIFSYLLSPRVGKSIRFLMDLIFAFSLFSLVFQFMHSILNGGNVPDVIAIAFSTGASMFLSLIFIGFLEVRIKKLKQEKLSGKKIKNPLMTKFLLILSTALLIVLCGLYFNHVDFNLATMSDRLEFNTELTAKIGLSIMGGIFLFLMYFGLKEGIQPVFYKVWLYLVSLTSVFIAGYVWNLFDQNWNVIFNLFITVILGYGIEKFAHKKNKDIYPI